MTEQRASEKDRDYFRRLGEWERENAEEDLRRHLALPLSERLARSQRMMIEWGPYLRNTDNDDHPEEFYARARRLGLIRSAPAEQRNAGDADNHP